MSSARQVTTLHYGTNTIKVLCVSWNWHWRLQVFLTICSSISACWWQAKGLLIRKAHWLSFLYIIRTHYLNICVPFTGKLWEIRSSLCSRSEGSVQKNWVLRLLRPLFYLWILSSVGLALGCLDGRPRSNAPVLHSVSRSTWGTCRLSDKRGRTRSASDLEGPGETILISSKENPQIRNITW